MRSYTLLFIVSCCVLLSTVSAGCLCVNGPCNRYWQGTKAQCFCWCQKTANSRQLGRDARCTYGPASQGSFCSLCSAGIYSPNEDSDFAEISATDDSQITSMTITPSNNQHVFPMQHCYCCGSCMTYSGSAKQCSTCAAGYRKAFINEQYWVDYVPHYSSGGTCRACGNVDPCKL
ncbi:hypothetical protein RCL1_008758 [Eukaryota sp. TZLM3-RCL]